ncbi:MAG: hypothetical protein WBX27_07000 [Specibacter sp.]
MSREIAFTKTPSAKYAVMTHMVMESKDSLIDAGLGQRGKVEEGVQADADRAPDSEVSRGGTVFSAPRDPPERSPGDKSDPEDGQARQL